MQSVSHGIKGHIVRWLANNKIGFGSKCLHGETEENHEDLQSGQGRWYCRALNSEHPVFTSLQYRVICFKVGQNKSTGSGSESSDHCYVLLTPPANLSLAAFPELSSARWRSSDICRLPCKINFLGSCIWNWCCLYFQLVYCTSPAFFFFQLQNQKIFFPTVEIEYVIQF